MMYDDTPSLLRELVSKKEYDGKDCDFDDLTNVIAKELTENNDSDSALTKEIKVTNYGNTHKDITITITDMANIRRFVNARLVPEQWKEGE